MEKKLAGSLIAVGCLLVVAGGVGLYQATQAEKTPLFKQEERSRSKPVDEGRVEYVFQRYEEKHRSVRASLKAYGKEVQALLEAKIKPADASIAVALLTELQRLNGERKLVEQWKSGAIPKAQYVEVMADSLMVMEYLTLMEAYGRALNELARNPIVNGTKLEDGALYKEAAIRFDRIFETDTQKVSALYDAKVVNVSPSAIRLVPIASQILSQGESALEYRVQFFAKYARNIIQKNQKYLRDVSPNTVAGRDPKILRSLSSVEAVIK